MRRLAALGLVGLLLLGCSTGAAPSVQSSTEEERVFVPMSKEYNIQVLPLYSVSEELPEGSLYVGPGKVWIGYEEKMGMYAGARAEAEVSIINRTNEDTPLVLRFRPGTYFSEGNLIAPADVVVDWVEVGDKALVVPARESRSVLVALQIPSEVPLDRTKFWYLTEKEATDIDFPAGGSWSEQFLIGEGVTIEELHELANLGYIRSGNLLVDDWGFLIVVKDARQTGMVQTQVGVKWLVRMKGR